MPISGQFSFDTPEILWHGGGNENGKPDPVYSVDIHPTQNILLTTGVDANVPPKGSVRLWKLGDKAEDLQFLVDFCDHQHSVNIARFSPCGKMIASASERQIVVYSVDEPSKWNQIEDVRDVERTWLRPSVTEIFDMDWSPDSCYLVIGAIDAKGEIIRISTRDNVVLAGHTNYVQGVAWDPLNAMVATQSSDRSCKFHQIRYKENIMVKLAPRGHVVARMNAGFVRADDNAAGPLTATDFGVSEEGAEETPTSNAPGISLFADSYVPSFFRRLKFSPDGMLVFAPAGVHRINNTVSIAPKVQDMGISKQCMQSHCVHVFSRSNLSSPCMSYIGLEEPAIAVRCCPRLFRMVADEPTLVPGNYRVVFAVVTIKAVLVFDTQHPHPILKLSAMHLAPINDAAWSSDGRTLVVCSSDGYVTFVRFEEGALGELLGVEETPEAVRKALPCVHNYVKPASTDAAPIADKQAAAAPPSAKKRIAPTKVVITPAAEVKAIATPSVSSPTTRLVTDAAVASPEMADSASVVIGNALDTSAEKKRKRIQPILVGPLPASEKDGKCVVTEEASKVQVITVEAKPDESLQEKKKKRITPTLLAPVTIVID